MEDRSTIFRPEAVENRARIQAPGDVVRIGAGWTGKAFWALVVLVVGALIAATQIEISRYVIGLTATDAGGRVLVLIPEASAEGAGVGDRVDISGASTEVLTSSGPPHPPQEIEERFGVRVLDDSVVLSTSARWSQDTAPMARVRVGTEPVLVALVPGLKALFGDEDA